MNQTGIQSQSFQFIISGGSSSPKRKQGNSCVIPWNAATASTAEQLDQASKTCVGTGSVFSRPTPLQLLQFESNGYEISDADDEDGSDFLDSYETERTVEMRQLGTVAFYDSNTRTRSPAMALMCRANSSTVQAMVELAGGTRMSYEDWLANEKSAARLRLRSPTTNPAEGGGGEAAD
eukprot:CAMPEP_0113667496 /NCGR_PEP_ID=MMETSP0038_2-20120614/3470_1 /TAXON_ID=2898 /ORGANISM="Cryptomonas paramecium" /LENGTH=177 /DNA_ID=CAMNT_0000583121 /DNA_START=35 /DNA_END=565 /DNA_ORIENTATION=- /assembly_acc=CAM_ASM_000170